MTSNNDAKSFLLGNSVRAAFTADDEVGTTVKGYVLAEPEMVQQYTYVSESDKKKGKTSEPDFWPAKNGRPAEPKMQMLIDLETDAQDDDDDDGVRRLYVKFMLQRALQKAIRNAKLRRLPEPGDFIEVTYTGRDTDIDPDNCTPKQLGEWMKSAKLFHVVITPNARKATRDAVAEAFAGVGADADDEPVQSRRSGVTTVGDEDDDEPVAGAGGARRSSGGRQARPQANELTDEQRARLGR